MIPLTTIAMGMSTKTPVEVLVADVDSDGFGDAETSVEAGTPSLCRDDTDCDDGDATVNPDAEEFCDEVDNDCDDDVDESDATDASLFYPDDDGDGFGSLYTTYTACDAPPGAVEDSSDCDDEDADVYPGADEVCDGVDNDCDGTVDGGCHRSIHLVPRYGR